MVGKKINFKMFYGYFIRPKVSSGEEIVGPDALAKAQSLIIGYVSCPTSTIYYTPRSVDEELGWWV